MKAAILTALGAIIALSLPIISADKAGAQSRKKQKSYTNRSNRSRNNRSRRHYTQRERDTLPIRITRPPGTSGYIYDDYPEWAARAFQPTNDR